MTKKIRINDGRPAICIFYSVIRRSRNNQNSYGALVFSSEDGLDSALQQRIAEDLAEMAGEKQFVNSLLFDSGIGKSLQPVADWIRRRYALAPEDAEVVTDDSCTRWRFLKDNLSHEQMHWHESPFFSFMTVNIDDTGYVHVFNPLD